LGGVFVAGMETARSCNPRLMSQSGFHGTRVFTTEFTENTEGMRRKRFFRTTKLLFSAAPLCSL
jgi:hypothetical protein